MLTDCTEVLSKRYTIGTCPFCHRPGRILQRPDKKYFGVCSNTKHCPGYNIRTRSFANPVDAVFAWNSACQC